MITDVEYARILGEGLRLWNEHKFFECHDKLEEAWKEVKQEKKAEPAKDPRRDFLHGIILAAVAYHHWRNGNQVGACRKRDEAFRLLRAYPDRFDGFALGRWRSALERDLGRLGSSSTEAYRDEGVPTLARV